ncbi:MAG: adenylate/guanylate cyclase domain-containing protein [Spirulinaceae cyanobacterium]
MVKDVSKPNNSHPVDLKSGASSPLASLATGIPGKIPLRVVLIVPFVVQIFAAVALTGYLSFRNGQQAVEDLANQLSGEITNRISEGLDSYLQTPHLINEINAQSTEIGQLKLQEFSGLEQHFLNQMKLFDSATYIYLGIPNGNFVGTGRGKDNNLEIGISGDNTNNNFNTYATNDKGNPTKLLSSVPEYNLLIRPWYLEATSKKKPAWGDIYLWTAPYPNLALPAVRPLYNEPGELLGVFAVDLSLLDISDFLQTLEVGRTGETFIIERNGLLVASSTSEKPYLTKAAQPQRLAANKSQEPLIKATTAYLQQKYNNLTQIDSLEQFDFRIAGNRHIVQVTPFQDEFGLDWLIVVVIPEADFMAQINANTRNTIILCLSALGIATLLGILTSRWITKPILRLVEASRQISQGQLGQTISVGSFNELQILARSFNQMAAQLRASFTTLEQNNEELEKRVERRTSALRQSEEKFSLAFHSSPDLIAITTLDEGRFRDVNESFLVITGYTLEEIIGKTTTELNNWVQDRDRYKVSLLLRKKGSVRNQEIGFYTKSGKVRTGLLSARIINLEGQECLLSVINDITERKRVQEALREKEEYLRLILDNIPQQVFWKDTNLVFQGCNKNWARATEVEDPELIIGKTDYDLLPSRQQAELYRTQDQRIIKTDTPELHIIELKQKPAPNGQPIWLDLNKFPIHDAKGKVVGILGVSEDITQRRLAEEALRIEQEKSERLLRNILPAAIAERLKQETNPIAEQFEEATILFADIVGFTPLSASISPTELVSLLNHIFSLFDQLAEKHCLEKIKTIGDAYMVAGGLPMPMENHTEAIAEMALDMQQAVADFQDNLYLIFPQKSLANLQIRIGINTGPVVAGVIGTTKFIYDLWGDPVNIASRMESSGLPGKIQVTAQTYEKLKSRYVLEKRGVIEVKGKGEMTTYWLMGLGS